jgi:hypothetical protein
MPGKTPGDIPDPRSGNAPEPETDGWPDAPTIPSFESLRAPRRRVAMDLLVPEPLRTPEADPVASTAPEAGQRPAPRPPDYADLLTLGIHVLGAVAAVPGRFARWSIREPARCLRRLLF